MPHSQPQPQPSAFSPLRFPSYRALWLTWVLSNTSLWMWTVVTAWLMVEMRTAPVWVALVQAAVSAPSLIFGLPFGAVADMVDRRRVLVGTYLWTAAIALAPAVLLYSGAPVPPLALLATTLAFGCGIAMRSPAYAATVPSSVPPVHVPPALILNAVAMNVSRVAGPLAAGVLIASAGAPGVFVVICVLAIASILLVRASRPRDALPAPATRRPVSFGASLRGGVAYAWQSRPLQTNLLRVVVFCGSAAAVPSLLPLVARDLDGASASTFTLLFSSMGAGAVLSMFFLHRLRAWLSRDQAELVGAIGHSLSMTLLVSTRSTAVAVVAMLVNGMCWITTANSQTVATQHILPDWVRARGMAIHQMALMGSMAAGAAFWGLVATVSSIPVSLGLAAVASLAGMAVVVRRFPHEERQVGAAASDCAPR